MAQILAFMNRARRSSDDFVRDFESRAIDVPQGRLTTDLMRSIMRSVKDLCMRKEAMMRDGKSIDPKFLSHRYNTVQRSAAGVAGSLAMEFDLVVSAFATLEAQGWMVTERRPVKVNGTVIENVLFGHVTRRAEEIDSYQMDNQS